MSEHNDKAYSILAPIYDDLGLSDYASAITEPTIVFLQREGWIGRQVLELGCGTGRTTAQLNDLGMDVVAVERNPDLMKLARLRLEDAPRHLDFIEDDFQEIRFPSSLDLVWAMGFVLNELLSLRQIETLFQKAYAALRESRCMVFDMYTLRGMGAMLDGQTEPIDLPGSAFIVRQEHFHYDTMSLRRSFTCFLPHDRTLENWGRHDAQFILRGYPIETMQRLAEKVGFEVYGLFTTAFEPFKPNTDTDGHYIMILSKPPNILGVDDV